MKMRIGDIKRGEIVICDLEPAYGSEQGGKRPVLVVQNDVGNKHSPNTIVVPITSRKFSKEHPFNVFVSKNDSGLERDSTILCNQVRTVDKSRIFRKVSSLNHSIMEKVDEALKISLDLN